MTGLSGVLVTQVWPGPQVGLMSWLGGDIAVKVWRGPLGTALRLTIWTRDTESGGIDRVVLARALESALPHGESIE